MTVYKDAIGGDHQAPTFIVAASDSLHPERADYVCDGTDDNVQIQAAIDALPSKGGTVLLLGGAYSIGAKISLCHGLTLRGEGISATQITLSDNVNDNMFEWDQPAVAASFISMRNMMILGNKANQTSGHGVYIHNNHGNTPKDMFFEQIWFDDCKEDGFHADDASWGIRVVNCLAEYNGGCGFFLRGNECFLSNLYSSENGTCGFSLRGYNIETVNCFADNNITYGFYCYLLDNSHLSNCFADKSTQAGFYIYQSECGSLMNCTANGRGASIRGFYFRGVSGNNTCRINMTGCISTNNTYGVYVMGDYVEDVLIIGSQVYGNSSLDMYTKEGVRIKTGEQHSEHFMDVLAVSATHIRSNEDLSAAIPITFTIDAQPDVPRTLSGHFDAHANITAYTIAIVGVDAKGNTITETKTEADGWDWETGNAFSTIASITMSARTGTGAGDTMDIGITDVIGLANAMHDDRSVFKIKKNNANAAVAWAQVNTTYDTYDMAVIGLAATDDFTIWYKSNLNIIS